MIAMRLWLPDDENVGKSKYLHIVDNEGEANPGAHKAIAASGKFTHRISDCAPPKWGAFAR